MNKIKLYAVSEEDADFLFRIMNDETVLDAMNEIPTQLCEWEEAINEWSRDDDEEDYIIVEDGIRIGWVGINNLSSCDKVAYLKTAAILPAYHNRGIGRFAISYVIDMLRQRGYSRIALYTDQDNHKARACYSKCGFGITEMFEEEMANGKTVARCKMELSL